MEAMRRKRESGGRKRERERERGREGKGGRFLTFLLFPQDHRAQLYDAAGSLHQ